MEMSEVDILDSRAIVEAVIGLINMASPIREILWELVQILIWKIELVLKIQAEIFQDSQRIFHKIKDLMGKIQSTDLRYRKKVVSK